MLFHDCGHGAVCVDLLFSDHEAEVHVAGAGRKPTHGGAHNVQTTV